VRILLDTPVFLWAITEDSRLSHRHQTYYRDPASELYLSVAACWEILIMVGVKKLDLPSPASRFLMHQMEMNRIALLGVRAAHFEELLKIKDYLSDRSASVKMLLEHLALLLPFA